MTTRKALVTFILTWVNVNCNASLRGLGGSQEGVTPRRTRVTGRRDSRHRVETLMLYISNGRALVISNPGTGPATVGGFRPAVLVYPDAYDQNTSEKKWPLVMMLHGYG